LLHVPKRCQGFFAWSFFHLSIVQILLYMA
jgi:hypothetical protein